MLSRTVERLWALLRSLIWTWKKDVRPSDRSHPSHGQWISFIHCCFNADSRCNTLSTTEIQRKYRVLCSLQQIFTGHRQWWLFWLQKAQPLIWNSYHVQSAALELSQLKAARGGAETVLKSYLNKVAVTESVAYRWLTLCFKTKPLCNWGLWSGSCLSA